LLVAIVIGSGIFADRLSPADPGLQLLENSLATAGVLVALILAFGSVSGAHFDHASHVERRPPQTLAWRHAVAADLRPNAARTSGSRPTRSRRRHLTLTLGQPFRLCSWARHQPSEQPA
jgi:hypothetical protein